MLLETPSAARSLKEVGVDVVGLVDLQDYFFKDDEEFNFAAFVEIVLSLRGGNNATVRDVIDLREFIMNEGIRVDDQFRTMMYEMTNLSDKMQRQAVDTIQIVDKIEKHTAEIEHIGRESTF